MDMSSSSEERKEMISSPSKGPKFPYGLRLNLDKETCEKLGISSAPSINSKVKFSAEAVVISVRAEDEEGDEGGYNIELQIIDMELDKEKNEKGVVDTLYKG